MFLQIKIIQIQNMLVYIIRIQSIGETPGPASSPCEADITSATIYAFRRR